MKTMLKSKSLLLIFMVMAFGSFNSYAQLSEEKMEERAKLIHKAIMSSDKMVWENFVKNNYSKKLLEKYEASYHVGMIKRLNGDFADSKIVSIKTSDKKVFMVVERTSDKHVVTFQLNMDPKDDYKINGLTIEAGDF